ncbi:MAG: ABC transporter ATP-binding protein [Acidobacteriota bacterium]
MASLELRGVSKRYHETTVIHRVDLAFDKGEFIVFVGPSGCGKSTLLRIICGLEPATEGDILIDGERVNDITAARRGLAMVFQSYALYPHMTVYQNLAFGLENIGTSPAEITTKIREAARMLQLDPYLHRRPTALSGGQRQRVAIGRAIVREPRIFLFDEPLSNLDAELRVQMRAEIAQLHHRLGTSMIYVTHDQVEAMTMASRIVVLRAGRVEQVGTPLDLYNNPANAFVAGFIGSPRMNFLKGVVAASEKGIAVLLDGIGIIRSEAIAPGLATGTPVTIGIRPEHVALGQVGINDVSFAVGHAEQLGGATTLFFPEPRFAVQLPGQVPARSGERMALNLPPQYVHVFDGAEKALPRGQPQPMPTAIRGPAA